MPHYNQSIHDTKVAAVAFKDNPWTKRLCITALTLCWIVGIAAMSFGAYLIYIVHIGAAQQDPWLVPHMVAEGIPLLVNLLVTLLVESTGYIHTVSLRWALLRDDKLEFNSNLRLLSSSASSKPNKWYSNILILAFITLAYASSALTFWHSDKATTFAELFGMHDDYVTVGGFPTFLLGISFLGLAAMSTWTLCSTDIPSWSSSPLDMAHVAESLGYIAKQESRCMRSVHDKKERSIPCIPHSRQKSAWSARGRVKIILFVLWLLVILGAVSVVVFSYLIPCERAICGFDNWSVLPGKKTAQFFFTPFERGSVRNSVAVILIFALTQSPLTLALHCVELQVNLSRDEAFWRRATLHRGCRLENYESVWEAFTSWQSITLAFFKTVLHWVFGLCVLVLNGTIYFGPVQLVYLSSTAAACAVFVTIISVRKPRGMQPAAYGHLQTLVDLVDEWHHPVIYWGQKAEKYGVCHAGTAGSSLAGVHVGLEYA